MNRTYLNGVATFSFTSKEELLEYIEDKKNILIAVNAEKILGNDTKLKQLINDNIGYVDGIGALMALRRKGLNAVKIPGAQLWLDIINKYHNEKTFYLLGATKEVINLTVKKLKSEYSGIRIGNFRDGYFDDQDLQRIKEDIKEKAPDIVFVAMGSPKQEYVMAELSGSCPALYMGLGGSFDLYSGKARPVPEWWKQIFKWEGFYRCFYDMKNITRWKRQIPVLRILYKVLLNKL